MHAARMDHALCWSFFWLPAKRIGQDLRASLRAQYTLTPTGTIYVYSIEKNIGTRRLSLFFLFPRGLKQMEGEFSERRSAQTRPGAPVPRGSSRSPPGRGDAGSRLCVAGGVDGAGARVSILQVPQLGALFNLFWGDISPTIFSF